MKLHSASLLLSALLGITQYSAPILAQPVPTSSQGKPGGKVGTATVRLPDGPVPEAPPAPGENAVTTLDGDQWFVIDSDVECTIKSVPSGLLRVTVETGPIRMKGRFVDSRVIVTREYRGKFVYTVEAVGKGQTTLVVTPKAGATTDADLQVRMLDVDNTADGCKPRPKPPTPTPPKPDPPNPPKPDPPVPPTPKPDPPIVGDGLRVLILFETSDQSKLGKGHQSIIYGATARSFLGESTVLGPDGKTREYRIYDKDVVSTGDFQHWQDAIKRARGKINDYGAPKPDPNKPGMTIPAVPWLVASNGKTGFEGPLPDDYEKFKGIVNGLK